MFFLLVFFLSVEVLLETDSNEFDFGNFPYYSYFFFSLCKIPTGESQSALKNTKQRFLVFLLSVDSVLEADPIEF
jgi:hypothetical protein